MKIGIIGSGNMARALGVRCAEIGHDVFFGARNEVKAADLARLAENGSKSGTIAAAAQFGEVLIWAVREPEPRKVFGEVAVLNGKIIVDINNRDYESEVRNGGWFDQAIAERFQNNAPAAHIIKGFNTIAMETFNTSALDLRAAGAQTFLAGENQAAKKRVAELSFDLGFEAVDVGSGPAAYRAVEALGDVIRLLMIDGKRGTRAHFTLHILPEPKLGSIGARGESEYA